MRLLSCCILFMLRVLHFTGFVLWLTWKCCSITWILPCSGHLFKAKSEYWKIISTICPKKMKIRNIWERNIHRLISFIVYFSHLVSYHSFSFHWISKQTCHNWTIYYSRVFIFYFFVPSKFYTPRTLELILFMKADHFVNFSQTCPEVCKTH